MTKRWDFTPVGRTTRRAQISHKALDQPETEAWLEATLNALRCGNSFCVLVNNLSPAAADRRRLDEQLARIAVLQATIVNSTSTGKEINALEESVSYAPYTFSSVNTYHSGSNIPMTQSWRDEGMETLLPLRIFPPGEEDERREAVLYVVGDQTDCENLERAFCEFYVPSFYEVAFSEKPGSQQGDHQATEFFVQWELFPDEAAIALGVDIDSPEFEQVMEQLVQMKHTGKTSPIRETMLPKTTPDRKQPDFTKYKRQLATTSESH